MNIRKIVLPLLIVGMTVLPMAVLAQGLVEPPVPQGTAQGDLVSAVETLINFFLILAALTAVVFLILGGFRYIFSQGDDDQAAQAKNTILYAVIGLLVIGLAAAIVRFVVNAIQSA